MSLSEKEPESSWGIFDVFKGAAEGMKDESHRRLKNPFVSAYVISWGVINYEVLIAIFSDGEYKEKIGYIAQHLYYSPDWCLHFGLPAAFAAASLLVLPALDVVARSLSYVAELVWASVKGWLDSKRGASDAEWKPLAQRRNHELRAIRKQALDSVKRFAGATLELYGMGVGCTRDAKKLGAEVMGHISIPDEVRNAIETNGFSAQGFRMLALMREEGKLSEERALRDSSGTEGDEYSRKVLALLVGARLAEPIWSEGAAPSYSLTHSGRTILDAIGDWSPETFAEP